MDKFSAYANNSIIYHAPPISWWQGWLLGNGSGGATIWNPEDKICFQLGHTDLLDRTEDTTIDGSGIPNIRHSLRGSININNLPLFDTFYIKDYNAITDISTGVMDMNGESEFGAFCLTSFYCQEPDVFALKYGDKTTEKAIHTLNLEKMGSRFFSRIWSGTVRDTSHGKGKTAIKAMGDVLLFSHEKEAFKMATAVKFSSAAAHSDHTGEYTEIATFEPTDAFEITLFATLGYGETLEEAEGMALEKMEAINGKAFEELRELKEKSFKNQLPDTHIVLPEDRYYENLWYTSRYNMRICYKGRYPAFFINGPFGGNRDKREWSDCWLHWNMHASHQGIIKNGDYDLFKAYADYKMRQIPSAKALAQKSYGCGGMVTQDQQKPDGGNRGREEDYFKLQVFPSLHTVIQFYQYWQFTGEESFFKDYLYPYFHLTMEFWRDYLVDEGGTLHVPRSHPYEFHNGYGFKDSLTELALLKSCFSLAPEIFKHLGEKDDLYTWCIDAGESLADFVEIPLDKEFVTTEKDGKAVYKNPFFFGDAYSDSHRLFAIGLSERVGEYISHTDTHKEIPILNNGGYGAFCSSYTSFIFPANLVNSDASPQWRAKRGASDRQNQLWENGRNALRTIRRIPLDTTNNVFHVQHEDTLTWTGHSLELPAFARMGLTEELEKAMRYYTENFQMFPQGMFNYHHRSRWGLDFSDTVMENGQERRLDFMPFVQHFSFEELGIFTETVDTMLLDSSENVIRLFSAYAKDAQIKLPAENGFVVEALQKSGELQYVKIFSKAGKHCNVRVPWAKCYISDGGDFRELAIKKSVAAFETLQGKSYTLVGDTAADTAFEFSSHEPKPIKNKVAIIGIPYRF